MYREAAAVGVIAAGWVAAVLVFGDDEAPAQETLTTETAVSVERVIDGDTVVTSAGTVRLLGIDAPDKGDCGYADATHALSTMLQPGKMVGLVATDKDTDQYNRLLRYIRVDETDAGYQLIRNEVADARYDSRDGYSSHPLEGLYRETDTVPNSACVEPVPPPPVLPGEPVPAPTPKQFVIVDTPDFFTPEYFPPQYFAPDPRPSWAPSAPRVIYPSISPPTPPATEPPTTPTPEPTETPTTTPEPEPTETETPTPEPTETPTTTPDPEPTETSTPDPEPTITPTSIPDPEPTVTFTPDPEPTETFIPLPEPTVTFTLELF